jgi:predicted dithiol-disulfide oxidoreductase (DUF899 family)
MTRHMTGTREEWLAARLELLEAEKELTRRSDELARGRQELPWVRVDKRYRFETDEGSASLADLFRGRSQLLVYHFMFDYGARLTDERRGCTGCSLVADHFDGVIPHLNGRDITLVCASIAPLQELQDYKRQMGWRFPWVSSRERLQLRLRRRLHRGAAQKRRRRGRQVGQSRGNCGRGTPSE